jgi:threonyl-tRNA synthetase
VRVWPASGAFTAEICNAINAAQVQYDVDDREERLGKKVRETGMDWVPYVIVVGDDEIALKKLTVT